MTVEARLERSPGGDDRPGATAHRGNEARLHCGVLLDYEEAAHVPEVGDVVPCRRHAFCPVASRSTSDGRSGPQARRGPPPRTQEELIAFLSRRSVTTIHALRERRFTLRVVAAAQRDGLVDADLVTGRVSLRVDTRDHM